MPSKRIIDYLESAVSDNTAHSQMDKLLLEDELKNAPSHWMRTEPEPFEMSPEDALPINQGMKSMKVVANIIGNKYVPDRVLKKRIAKNNLSDSMRQEVKKLKKFIHGEEKTNMSAYNRTSINEAKKKIKELKDEFLKLNPGMKKHLHNLGFQQGGEINSKSLLSYTNPTIQDETAHDNINQLLIENELENITPSHWMRSQPESFKMSPEDALPIAGAAKILKGTGRMKNLVDSIGKTVSREEKMYEVMQKAANKFPQMDAGGSDKAAKDLLTTLWIQKLFK